MKLAFTSLLLISLFNLNLAASQNLEPISDAERAYRQRLASFIALKFTTTLPAARSAIEQNCDVETMEYRFKPLSYNSNDMWVVMSYRAKNTGTTEKFETTLTVQEIHALCPKQ
jgi:hypothetical protein